MSTIKILLTLALILLIAGAAGYAHALSEQKKEKQLLRQQQERLKTKLVELNKLFGNETNIKSFSADVSDEKLQEDLAAYAGKETAASNILTASIICMASGAAIFAGWILFSIVCFILAGLRRLKNFLARILKRWKEIRADRRTKRALKKSKNTQSNQSLESGKPKRNLLTLIHLKKLPVNLFRSLREIKNKLIAVRLKKVKRTSEERTPNDAEKPIENFSVETKSFSEYFDKSSDTIDIPPHEEKPPVSKEPIHSDVATMDLNAKLLGQMEQNIRKTVLAGYYQSALKVQNSLKAQNENLQKQVAEVMQMAQTIHEVSTKNNEPVKNTLDELTRQISAISEYASSQHDRVVKLQEGYDWNIIRTFGLRVIRCLDNLENRIARLSEQNIDTKDLEEIKDELLFALESSGIEQFKPEINSDYDGQEKIAEVIKDKAYPNDPNMKGKIAQVVRNGYRYVIDDSNFKVIRAAQVRLFC